MSWIISQTPLHPPEEDRQTDRHTHTHTHTHTYTHCLHQFILFVLQYIQCKVLVYTDKQFKIIELEWMRYIQCYNVFFIRFSFIVM